MRAHIQRWGNSLALRIPKSFAVETELKAGTAVEVSVVDGKLVITPVRPVALTLDELLSRITPENLHDETDTGPSVGGEAW